MKKHILIPVVIMTTPMIVACTQKSSDIPPPSPVTGRTETVNPVENPATPTVLTRTETVTYATPASPQDPIEFSVTVTDGIITSASATPKSDNEISQKLQTAFAADVATKVVGMKAADLDVDVIGGASLTTGAFEMFARSF